jgi:hypothetical protein
VDRALEAEHGVTVEHIHIILVGDDKDDNQKQQSSKPSNPDIDPGNGTEYNNNNIPRVYFR